jgi:hypothetical protein
MVARLAAGDATVNELVEPYDVIAQAVSKHLKVLEDAGLVSRRREAQRRPDHLEAVFNLMTKWIGDTAGRRRSGPGASTTCSGPGREHRHDHPDRRDRAVARRPAGPLSPLAVPTP